MVTTLPSAGVRVKGGKPPSDILDVNRNPVRQPREVKAASARAHPLTKREAQILSLVAEGNSNKSIGTDLGISERTVKSHLSSIMSKLGALDRTHAVTTAFRFGLISIQRGLEPWRTNSP